MSGVNKSLVLGFLWIRPRLEALRGGYLLTTEYGRPLEFHYTSPLRMTPEQRTLYGKTFEEQVWTEILAKPMTDRQSTAPRMILVAQRALVELRRLIPAPVIAVAEGLEPPLPKGNVPEPRCHPEFPHDLASFEKLKTLLPPAFDWIEPFQRIDLALAEIREPDLKLAS